MVVVSNEVIVLAVHTGLNVGTRITSRVGHHAFLKMDYIEELLEIPGETDENNGFGVRRDASRSGLTCPISCRMRRKMAIGAVIDGGDGF